MAKPAFKNIKIIWHMGFQKTGTTSFQSILRRNEDTLRQHISIFPKRNWTQDVQNAGLAYWANPTVENEKALTQAAQDIRSSSRDDVLQNLNKPVGRNESLPSGALQFMREINRSRILENGLDIVRRKILNNPGAFT
jgi:hypothetical protein